MANIESMKEEDFLRLYTQVVREMDRRANLLKNKGKQDTVLIIVGRQGLSNKDLRHQYDLAPYPETAFYRSPSYGGLESNYVRLSNQKDVDKLLNSPAYSRRFCSFDRVFAPKKHILSQAAIEEIGRYSSYYYEDELRMGLEIDTGIPYFSSTSTRDIPETTIIYSLPFNTPPVEVMDVMGAFEPLFRRYGKCYIWTKDTEIRAKYIDVKDADTAFRDVSRIAKSFWRRYKK